jgi:hypothetical protein
MRRSPRETRASDPVGNVFGADAKKRWPFSKLSGLRAILDHRADAGTWRRQLRGERLSRSARVRITLRAKSGVSSSRF